jgi:hypothetical protein
MAISSEVHKALRRVADLEKLVAAATRRSLPSRVRAA